MSGMIDLVKKMAHSYLKELTYKVMPTPLETLKTINFEVESTQSMDQQQVIFWNLKLDKRSCLGRIAQAAAVVEKHFPDVKLEAGEVLEDYLAGLMLLMLAEDRNRAYDPSFMQELLMYEDPHLVLFVDGVQFEPLSLQLGSDIKRPRVGRLPFWESIVASIFIARNHMLTDPREKLGILEGIENICPGLVLTRENICEPLELLGRMDEVIEMAKWCFERRPCARTLYVLSVLTKEQKYHDFLVGRYSKEVIRYF